MTADAVDGIYFQGLVLNPLPIMDRLESELHTTVVASTTSMMWYVLSKLGSELQRPRWRGPSSASGLG